MLKSHSLEPHKNLPNDMPAKIAFVIDKPVSVLVGEPPRSPKYALHHISRTYPNRYLYFFSRASINLTFPIPCANVPAPAGAGRSDEPDGQRAGGHSRSRAFSASMGAGKQCQHTRHEGLDIYGPTGIHIHRGSSSGRTAWTSHWQLSGTGAVGCHICRRARGSELIDLWPVLF